MRDLLQAKQEGISTEVAQFLHEDVGVIRYIIGSVVAHDEVHEFLNILPIWAKVLGCFLLNTYRAIISDSIIYGFLVVA